MKIHTPEVVKKLQIKGDTSGVVGIKAPTSFTDYDLTLPENDGDSGQAIITDGNGNLSFADIGGGGLTDITYADLVTAIGNSALTPGGYYRITDFATRYYMLDCDDNNRGDITATTEPLIVFAVSVNNLSPQAFSQTYPTDIIQYDWNPDNWLTSFWYSSDGSTIISGFKGVITYRHDTQKNLVVPYDLRGVVFRRWKNGASDYVGSNYYNTYDANSWVSKRYSEYGNNVVEIWRCVQDTTILGAKKKQTVTLTGTSGTARIRLSIPGFMGNQNFDRTVTFNTDLTTSASDFVTAYAADYHPLPGPFGSAGASLEVTSSGAVITFESSTFFPNDYFANDFEITNLTGDLSGSVSTVTSYVASQAPGTTTGSGYWAFLFKMTGTEYVMPAYGRDWTNGWPATSNINDYIDYPTFPNGDATESHDIIFRDIGNMANNVFIETGTDNYALYFGSESKGNTFVGQQIYRNTFGDRLWRNFFGTFFSDNKVGDYAVGNSFRSSTYRSVIGNEVSTNWVTLQDTEFGSSSTANKMGQGVIEKCVIGRNFSSNKIGIGFQYCEVGDGVNDNTFGDNFTYNKIGTYRSNCVFGNDVTRNDFSGLPQFSSITCPNNFRKNIFLPGATSSDYSTATHVIGDYTCEISSSPDGTPWLKYTDNTGTQQIVSPTT